MVQQAFLRVREVLLLTMRFLDTISTMSTTAHLTPYALIHGQDVVVEVVDTTNNNVHVDGLVKTSVITVQTDTHVVIG